MMYILTICDLSDGVTILWQQAATDKRTLEVAAVDWAKKQGWVSGDEGLSPDEEFEEVSSWFDNMVEEDDPRMILRKADAS